VRQLSPCLTSALLPPQIMMLMATEKPIPHDLTYVWNLPVELTETKMKCGHQEQRVGVVGWGDLDQRMKNVSRLDWRSNCRSSIAQHGDCS
jgi:hypothetical protein